MKDTYEIDPAIMADLAEIAALFDHVPPYCADRQAEHYQPYKVYCLQGLRNHMPILTKQKIWTCWRREGEGKPPVNPNTDRPSSKSNSNTWVNFNTCLREVERGHMDGLGCYLPDGFAVIDIDKVEQVEGGGFSSFMLQKLTDRIHAARAAGCYVEVSQSGSGYHILGRLPDDLTFTLKAARHIEHTDEHCVTDLILPARTDPATDKAIAPDLIYLTGNTIGHGARGWQTFDDVAELPVDLLKWAMGLDNDEPSNITSVSDTTSTGAAGGRSDLRDDLATLDTIDREQRPVKSTASTCASEPKPYAHDIPRHAHNGPYMPTEADILDKLATMCPDMFAVYNGNLGADASSEIFKLCTKLLYLANNDTSKASSILRGAYAVVDHSNTKHAGQRYPEGDWLEHTLHAALQMRLSQSAKSYEWHKPYEGYSQDTQTEYQQSDTASIGNQYTDRVTDTDLHRESGATVNSAIELLKSAMASQASYIDFVAAYNSLCSDDKTSLYIRAMMHPSADGLGLTPHLWEHIMTAGTIPPESDAFFFDELTDDAFIEQPLPFLNNSDHPFFIKYTSHLLAGAPRAGKSELLYQLIAGWAGCFKRIIIWSEERKSVWQQRRKNYKAAGIDIGRWKIYIHPSEAEKEAILNSIDRDDLLAVDCLRSILRCKDENAAAENGAVIQPVTIATKDATLIALHHGRKNNSGSVVDRIAGNNSIPGAFDRILYLNTRIKGGYQKLEAEVRGKPVRPVNVRWDEIGRLVPSDIKPSTKNSGAAGADGDDGSGNADASGNSTSTAKPKGKMAVMANWVIDILAEAKTCTGKQLTTKQILSEVYRLDSEASEATFREVIKRLCTQGDIVKYETCDRAGKTNYYELPELAQCHERDAGTTCTEGGGDTEGADMV